jgi:RNA polymerase primary sigma factor
MNELITKWKKAKEQLTQKLKRSPMNDEIAKKIKLPKGKIDDVNFWLTTRTSSLDEPIGDEGESQVMDLIQDENAVTPSDEVEAFLNKQRVNNLLEKMSSRERKVLDMRFGLADGKTHTLAEVADKLKVSRERVRQIEEKALKKLRKFVEEQE